MGKKISAVGPKKNSSKTQFYFQKLRIDSIFYSKIVRTPTKPSNYNAGIIGDMHRLRIIAEKVQNSPTAILLLKSPVGVPEIGHPYQCILIFF